MPRAKQPFTIDELLQHLSGDPHDAIRFVGGIHRYPNSRDLDSALEGDPRFREPLRRFVAAWKDSTDVLRWMSRLVPKDDPTFVPILVEVFRAFHGDASTMAEHLLLEIEDPRGLQAMADLAGKTSTTYRVGPITALMALDAARAYDRAMEVLAIDASAAWIVLGQVSESLVAADRRWISFAARYLEDAHRITRDRARQVIEKLASSEEQADIASKSSKPQPTAAARAKAAETYERLMSDLLAKLPEKSFQPARSDAAMRLSELESLLGHVPAAVRAFYTRIDSIHIARGKPRDAFIVVPLAEVLEDARAWKQRAKPESTPRAIVQRFQWPVTPDGATKSGFSGGPAYGFEAPTDDDDPVLDAPRKPAFSKFVTGALRLRRTT